MGYFCDFKTLITVLKSTHNYVKLVPLESVDRDESNGTNFRYQLEKMSQQVKKIFRFANEDGIEADTTVSIRNK